MKKTIYLLKRGDDDSGLQVICAYTTEKDAKQALLALAKEDGGGSLEIKWLTPTSYQVIDPKDPDRCIVDDAGIQECTLEQNEEPELKVKKRYLIVRRVDNAVEGMTILNSYSTNEEAVERLKAMAKEDSSKYRKPYVWWLSTTNYRIFDPPESPTIRDAAFILPETVSVYENTISRTVYLLVTDNISGSDVISVFETKEAALTALKDRAANDVNKKDFNQVLWINPTQYNLLTGGIDLGYMNVTTVKIIERTLHVEGV